MGVEASRALPSVCPVCGTRLGTERARCPNVWCRTSDRSFSVVFSVGFYAGALRHALLRYKYRPELWLSSVFAQQIARYLDQNSVWFEEFDLITCVPAYTGEGARRNWDPVGTVLAELGPLAPPGWHIAGGVVAKTAETRPMQRLSSSARRTLAAGALRRSLVVEKPALVRSARVLVVDDVMTDGCTLREVARVLHRAGALEVAGLVLARLPWVDQVSASGPTRVGSSAGRPLVDPH